jgi:hypothetical protein
MRGDDVGSQRQQRIAYIVSIEHFPGISEQKPSSKKLQAHRQDTECEVLSQWTTRAK